MKKTLLLISSMFLLTTCGLSSCSCEETKEDGTGELDDLLDTHNPFDYPGNFEAPELAVDGIKDEVYDTLGSEPLYINKGAENEMKATFYRGESGLYAFFEVKDKNLLTDGDNAGDDVTHSDSCELYLDTKNDGGNKPQTDDFQLNFGIHNKTRIMQGSGQNWGNWMGLVQYENVIHGTINDDSDVDTGRDLEVMIPYKELGVAKDDPIGIALGRVDKADFGSVVNKDYFWYGLSFNGISINPQDINQYAVWLGNEFYSRDDVPEVKNVFGVIKDSAGNVLVDVKVKLNDKETTTDSSGSYRFSSVPLFNENTLKQAFVEQYNMYDKIAEDPDITEADVTDVYVNGFESIPPVTYGWGWVGVTCEPGTVITWEKRNNSPYIEIHGVVNGEEYNLMTECDAEYHPSNEACYIISDVQAAERAQNPDMYDDEDFE